MATSWAYLFAAEDCDPYKDRYILDRGGLRSIIVPVPDFETAAKVAIELAEEGIASIELCGYFGIAGANKILNAVEGKIPVGVVTFGVESLSKIARAYEGTRDDI